MEIVESQEQGTGEAGAQAPAAAPEAPDFDKLVGAFEERVGARFDAMEERLAPPEPDAAGEIPDPADVDAFFADDDFEVDGTLTDAAQERHFWATVQHEAAQIAEQKVNEALSPIQAEREDERRGTEADALEAKYLELQDADVVEKVLDRAVRHAQRLGVPADQVNSVATEPAFIELVYLAMKAEEQTAGEPAPSSPGVQLESGGAAGPAAPQDAPDLGDRIVKLAGESKFRLGR